MNRRYSLLSEIILRPFPVIEVVAHPAAALDVRGKRLLDKELRAAWGEKRARWLSSADATQRGDGPTLYLSCQEDVAAGAIALNVRIGLAHLVSGVRRRLPEWDVLFTARGSDGLLQLAWGLEVGPDGMARSLLGQVPKHQQYKSEGRRFWAKRDGGVSLLNRGIWRWDPLATRWQSEGRG
jgi:hypothetical protein